MLNGACIFPARAQMFGLSSSYQSKHFYVHEIKQRKETAADSDPSA